MGMERALIAIYRVFVLTRARDTLLTMLWFIFDILINYSLQGVVILLHICTQFLQFDGNESQMLCSRQSRKPRASRAVHILTRAH